MGKAVSDSVGSCLRIELPRVEGVAFEVVQFGELSMQGPDGSGSISVSSPRLVAEWSVVASSGRRTTKWSGMPCVCPAVLNTSMNHGPTMPSQITW